ncbi:MAG: DUF1080 domain-containing protein [Pirellulaceae bacterium]|nr:DUF1080 domain-containing protein [Pirellulaceae bacterium]
MQLRAGVYTLLIILAAFQPTGILGQEPTALFNGKDLSGWVLVNTPPETWSVKDGMLVCTGKPIGELRTENMYHNFELELEWRHMVPGGNAGVFVWADDITSRGVPFHRSVEVQVLENAYGNSQSHTTHGDIFPIHGAKMTPINGRGGGSRAFPTEERSKPSPEWNHYRIVCNDGNISLAVNGKVVTQGKEASPRKGYICLESEGGIVHYRNLRIKELPETPVDAKDVAVSNRGYRSIYTGLNLNGWKVNEAAKEAWLAKDWVLAFDGRLPGEQARMETVEAMQLNGFVMDFRFTEKSEQIAVTLPGSSDPLVFLAKGDSPYSASLEKVGSWNRIEAIAKSGQVQFIINGKSHELTRSLGKGSISIVPTGPIELANIFVR